MLRLSTFTVEPMVSGKTFILLDEIQEHLYFFNNKKQGEVGFVLEKGDGTEQYPEQRRV